jgi:integrase
MKSTTVGSLSCKTKYGQGTVYLMSNGHYRAQVCIDGKRIGKTFHSKMEAIFWRKMAKTQFNHLVAGKTLSRYLDEWVVTLLDNRPKTLYQYRNTIKVHIKPRIGEIPLTDLDFGIIDQFIKQLQRENIGVRTIQIIYSVLHNALNEAVRYKYILENPTVGVKLPKHIQKDMKVLMPDEINCLLTTAKNTSIYTLIYLAVITGMRLGELLGLKWSDINFTEGTLEVRRQAYYVPHLGIIFAELKTISSRRTIDLCSNAKFILSEEKERIEIVKKFAGPKWQDNDLVFPNSFGKPRDASQIRKIFNELIVKSGVTKIRFHDLRHTTASLLLNSNIAPIKVSKVLGHSKPSTTMDIYGHYIHDKSRETAAVFDKLIRGA